MKYTILLLLIFLSIPLHATPLDVMQNVPTTTYTSTTNRTLNLMPNVVVPVTTPTNIVWDRLSVTITNYNATDDTLTYTLGGLTLVSSVGGVFTFSANYPTSATWQAFLRSLTYKNNGWPKPDIRPRIVTVKLFDSKEPLIRQVGNHYYYTDVVNPVSLVAARTAVSSVKNFLGHKAYLLTVSTTTERTDIENIYGASVVWWLNTTNPAATTDKTQYLWAADTPEAGQQINASFWSTGNPSGNGNQIYFPYIGGYDDIPGNIPGDPQPRWLAEFGGFDDNTENNTLLSEITREKTITIYSHVHNAPQMGVVH